MYPELTPGLVDEIRTVVGPGNIITEAGPRERYAADETPGYRSMPDLVVTPEDTAAVREVMRLAHTHRIPLTPRGGGTGLSAGAVPVFGGVVVSCERMCRVSDIDQRNLMAVVEPGVVTGDLDRLLANHGLFFPPDPVSMDSCTIGGNIAECAGGPRAMKYGVARHHVTGLEVVMADGTTLSLGGKLLKNVAGYDLMNLMIGSEGTLGVVTRATLRLLPRPQERCVLLIPLPSLDAATELAAELTRTEPSVAAIELVAGAAVRILLEYLERSIPHPEAPAQVIIEIHGDNRTLVDRTAETIAARALELGAREVSAGDRDAEIERIWDIRRKTGEALKALLQMLCREDLVVPKEAVAALVQRLDERVRQRGYQLYAFGHLGDGNIHADVGRPDRQRPVTEDEAQEVRCLRREMYQIALQLGGTITAEHGVGLAKRDYLELAVGSSACRLMSQIKQAFDPRGILNPGKVLVTG